MNETQKTKAAEFKHLLIPPELWPYEKKPAWFATYYGEWYYGIIVECPNYDRGFFIIQNNKIKEYRDLQDHEQEPESYRKLGREIRDSSIITKIKDEQFAREIDMSMSPQTNAQVFKRMFVFGAGASTYCKTGAHLDQNGQSKY